MASKSKPPSNKDYYTRVDKDEVDKWAHGAVADHKFSKHAISGLKRAKPLKEK